MLMSRACQTVVCKLDEMQDPGSRGFVLSLNEQLYDVFIVRQGQQVFSYLNSCPHTGGPLDWVPDQFLSLEKNYIQCATHNALFRFNDGYCVAGPCAGTRLTAVPVVIESGEIIILHGNLHADN
jgi:nitrite reductase/ring-hydroxylating ferredoxin subunit